MLQRTALRQDTPPKGCLLEMLALQVLREWHFDWQFMMRGLIIDKKRGNMLKVDRHKYVKLAFHGFQPLSREQRLATYAQSQVRAHMSVPLMSTMMFA